MVAFLSPKKNPIDIVQAVGRVLRKHHSKAKGGFAFLPVFVREGEDEESAIAESDWSGCYEVLQALREQDEPLSVKLSKCARGNGELPGQIIVMDGRKREGREPESDRVGLSEGMRRAIRVKMVKPFNRDSDGRKKELLLMAHAMLPRPRGALSTILCNYCSPGSGSFDATFAHEIHGLASHWFNVYPSSETKAKLLEMARLGKPRPSISLRLGYDKEERRLGRALSGYTCPSAHSRCYDKNFDLEVRKLAPQWFLPPSSANHTRLLTMAKAGQPKPKYRSKEDSLRHALNSYVNPRNVMYNAAFSTKLRRLAPHWFRRLPRTK
jgi:hypothetical protein